MKKYNKIVAIISPLKMALAMFCLVLVTVIFFIFAGTDNGWSILCGWISSTLIFFTLLVTFATSIKYRYTNKYIEVLYPPLFRRKLSYSRFSAAVISNAAFNNGYGGIRYGTIPMNYKVKTATGTIKVTFPFITLHEFHEYRNPVAKIKSGMSSQEIFMKNNSEKVFLGICWFNSLKELLKYSEFPIYVLEDVYLRYQGQFDIIFSEHKENANRFFIITDHSIAYHEYLKEELV